MALAELWPSHVAYIVESLHLHWEVPTEQGSIVMHCIVQSVTYCSLKFYSRT